MAENKELENVHVASDRWKAVAAAFAPDIPDARIDHFASALDAMQADVASWKQQLPSGATSALTYRPVEAE